MFQLMNEPLCVPEDTEYQDIEWLVLPSQSPADPKYLVFL